LVVIRSPDIEAAARCYETLGLCFGRHRHGSGPEHFACEQGGLVFEIYPGELDGARLGFSVENLVDSVESWIAAGGSVVSAPKPSPWGLRAVLADPDGREIELIGMNNG
jgi:hypothetical protein